MNGRLTVASNESLRQLAVLLAVGVPLLYSVTQGTVGQWLRGVHANVGYLSAQFSTSPGQQKENLALSGGVPVSSSEAVLSDYRRVQLSLAPVAGCPTLPTGLPPKARNVAGEQVEELSIWVEQSSVIPICVSKGSLDNAVAYYRWLTSDAPNVAQHLSGLRKTLASELVERAFDRYAAGDSMAGMEDWESAHVMGRDLAGAEFYDLVETLSLSKRSAQQFYLLRDLEKYRGDPAVRVALAQSYNEAGEPASAEEVVAPLLSKLSGDTHAWQQYGQALLGQRRFEEAEGALFRAVDVAPGESQALNRLGVLYAVWGRAADAEETFRRALATTEGEGSYWLWEHLGDVLVQQGKTAQAVEAYRSAIATAPDALNGSVRRKLANLER